MENFGKFFPKLGKLGKIFWLSYILPRITVKEIIMTWSGFWFNISTGRWSYEFMNALLMW